MLQQGGIFPKTQKSFDDSCNNVLHQSLDNTQRFMFCISFKLQLSRRMGKPTICIGENKGADQLRSDCEADQRLCFHYRDSTILLLSKSKISSLLPSSVTVQPGLCQTWLGPKLLVFSRIGSVQSFIIIHC